VRVSWFDALKTVFFLGASLYLAAYASQAQDEHKTYTEASRPTQVQQVVPSN
jgi:hypothetical protein